MSSEITCPSCKEVYSSQNPPKTLVNCSHNICLKCIKEQILCPIDRVRIQLRRFTLEAFKTNQSLLSKVEKGKESPEVVKSARSKISSSNSKITSKDKKMQSSTKKQQISPTKEKSSSKKRKQSPKEEKQVTIEDFQSKIEVELITPEPSLMSQKSVKSPSLQRKKTLSPKKQVTNFDTCLLHSKRADLICLQDKALICANCGLFGEHKHHTIIPFDDFLNQYSLLTEECFKNYEELQSREDKMNIELIGERINEILSEKRMKQLKQIKTFIKDLNNLVRNVQKQLISQLDLTINYKKDKLVSSLSFSELQSKKDDFMTTVQGMTQGLEGLFNLEGIEKYIPFIDPNSSHSYVLEQGEYLIRQIDNYSKMVQQRVEEDAVEFKFVFEQLKQDMLSQFSSISSCDINQIKETIENHKKQQQKKAQNSLKNGTPSRMKSCRDTTVLIGKSAQKQIVQKEPSPIKQKEDNSLLLGIDSCLESPTKKEENISPIQPLSKACNIQYAPHLTNPPEFFFKTDILQPAFTSQYTNKKAHKPPVNKTVNPSKMNYPTHHRIESCENQLSQSIVRHKSKTKSNNGSNNMTQRELLYVLNQKSDNKKKRKLDLPEKYAKIYDDLHKDRLEVVDFGGAFLGDNTILTISELFPCSKGKLKQVKLMNNKITDDIFAELISRCRSITSLNLSYNSLSEKCLDWLEYEAQHLGELRYITLSHNKIVLRSNRERIEELKKRGLNISL